MEAPLEIDGLKNNALSLLTMGEKEKKQKPKTFEENAATIF